MQFLDRIRLARSDEQYRSTRRIFKLNQIVCIGQPSGNYLSGYVVALVTLTDYQYLTIKTNISRF